MKRSRTDVCVVGGGAAGMMAAITAADAGAEVVLLERGDRLGAKLRITGKGRCNVTTDCSPTEMLENSLLGMTLRRTAPSAPSRPRPGAWNAPPP